MALICSKQNSQNINKKKKNKENSDEIAKQIEGFGAAIVQAPILKKKIIVCCNYDRTKVCE